MESIKGFGPTVQKVIENIKLEDIVTRPLCDLEPIEQMDYKYSCTNWGLCSCNAS